MAVLFAYLLAAFFGGSVGTVEIFQRYRAEPFPALKTRWGGIYVAFNAAMAAAAFWLLAEVGELTGTSTPIELVQAAAVAGFGSSVVLRSKLLDVKLGEGKSVAVGPEIVIQTFLSVFDRELDRTRGQSRFETVRTLFSGVDFDRVKLCLPLQLFQALQSVTEEETATLMQRIGEADEMDSLSSQDKSYLLGYYLLDLVGEEFLTDILSKHKDDFVLLDPPDPGSDESSAPSP